MTERITIRLVADPAEVERSQKPIPRTPIPAPVVAPPPPPPPPAGKPGE